MNRVEIFVQIVFQSRAKLALFFVESFYRHLRPVDADSFSRPSNISIEKQCRARGLQETRCEKEYAVQL